MTRVKQQDALAAQLPVQKCKTADRVRQPTAELMLIQTAAGAVAVAGLGHTTGIRILISACCSPNRGISPAFAQEGSLTR